MKIAVFYPKGLAAAWSLQEGMVCALKRMGHNVLDCATPPNPNAVNIPTVIVDKLKTMLPTLEELKSCDAILVSGPEHIACWLDVVYGAYPWKHEITIPKLSWYHETRQRADGNEFRFEELKQIADYHFFPAAQDADYFDQEHLYGGRSFWAPFAVDTEIFKPSAQCNKKYGVIFIGSVYGMRAAWLEKLGEYSHPEIKIGRCHYETIEGADIRRSMTMMADNMREARIFLNLPPLSLHHVTKVMEVMACGTFLVTPALPKRLSYTEVTGSQGSLIVSADMNNVLFKTNEHLIYYNPAQKAQLGRALSYWLAPENEEQRETIARAGCELIHKEHTLEKRFEFMFDKAGLKETVQ